MISAAATRAQSMTLEECGRKLDEQLQVLKDQHREKVVAMQRSYLAALLRYENEAKSQGDLTGVQAARAEMARVEDVENLNKLDAFGMSEHDRIRQMQGILSERLKTFEVERAEGVVQLVESVKGFVERTSMELTQKNDIDAALEWRAWGERLDQHQEVAVANKLLNRHSVQNPSAPVDATPAKEFHPALRGTPVKLVEIPAKEFPNGTGAYKAGCEPPANDRKLSTTSIPNAKGAGGSFITARIKLVDQGETLNSNRSWWSSYKETSELFVPRIEFNPLMNKPLGRSLVVFDLYKRGSGSKRELIQTNSVLLPPLEAQQKVVVDARPYAYETQKYRSRYSTYRYDYSSADEFYGYIVTIFDENGEMIFQRSTERALNDHAREHPPQ